MSWGRLDVVRKVVAMTFNMYAASVRRVQPELMILNKTETLLYAAGYCAMEYRVFRAPGLDDDLLLMAFLDLDKSLQLNEYTLDLAWKNTGKVIMSRVVPGDLFGEDDRVLTNRLVWETALFLKTLSPTHVTDALAAHREVYAVTRH
jgi:hypothetical protein